MTEPVQHQLVPTVQSSIGAWSGNRTAPFLNGSWGVRAKDSRIIAAWAVDFALVLVPVLAVATSSAQDTGSIGAGIFLGIVVWFIVPWIYGFCCAGGNTLGTLIAGTRLVKLRDGAKPGFWRNGWLMFLRTVLFPLIPLNALLDAINGGGSETVRKHHVSIDKAATKALYRGHP